MSLFFSVAPRDFEPKVHVSTCSVFCNGETLLLQSSKNGIMPLTWGVPGGKAEIGETPEITIRRELFEELGGHYRDLTLVYVETTYVRHPLLDYVLHLFRSDIPSKYPILLNPHEHLTFMWISPNEIESFNLLEGQEEAFYLSLGQRDRVVFRDGIERGQ